jgi:hypothetical protein
MADYIFDLPQLGINIITEKYCIVYKPLVLSVNPWVGEKVYKAALNWLSEVLTYMNILLLKRKDILRVNSFAFYNFGSSKCLRSCKRPKQNGFHS